MDQIAPFIITRFSSQPDLLGEACRVMSIAPIDFIGITLPRTLPELFASCDQRVLELIAKELSTKASSLLLKHSHGILAHIFLSNQATTTKALNFVIKVLTDATSSVIDIQSVVKSCVVPLLAELVIVMGDERPEVAQNVCASTIIRTNSLVNKLLGSCCLEESRASPCHCERQNLSTRTFGCLPQNIHAWTHLRYQ
jgi:serine/threonine-protein kinase ATR